MSITAIRNQAACRMSLRGIETRRDETRRDETKERRSLKIYRPQSRWSYSRYPPAPSTSSNLSELNRDEQSARCRACVSDSSTAYRTVCPRSWPSMGLFSLHVHGQCNAKADGLVGSGPRSISKPLRGKKEEIKRRQSDRLLPNTALYRVDDAMQSTSEQHTRYQTKAQT
jgi:hypothetical protein